MQPSRLFPVVNNAFHVLMILTMILSQFGLAVGSVSAEGDPPGAFSKSGPTDLAIGISTSPTFTWETSSNAVSYEYCIDDLDDDDCPGGWVDAGTDTFADLSGLFHDTTYYWQVRAVNLPDITLADGGVWWSFTTLTPGEFGKSGPVDASTGISTSPTLSWGASSNAAFYAYCINTTNDEVCHNPGAEVGDWTSVGSDTLVDLSGLRADTTYYWQVRAVADDFTFADDSTWWSFTTTQVKVGLVTDSVGIPENGFNWLSWQGVLEAETEYGVIGTVYVSTGDDQADYEAALQLCVTDGNQVCIGANWTLGDAIGVVAAANPGVTFAVVDIALETPPANLRAITFDSAQVGYLAGALAGMMTVSDVVGDIGGMEIPPVTAFTEGFHNGAQCANPDVLVLMDYIGNFWIPADGAAMAQDMIDNHNADVIYAAAGPAGSGAILYSTQDNVWGIGVDLDEYLTTFGNGTVDGSDMLLTSTMKHLDVAVYQTIEDILNDSFTSGTVVYDLANGGVGLAPYHATFASIPESTRNYIDGLEQDIIDGIVNINDTCRSGYGNFNVWLSWNGVHGYGWPLGEVVTLMIDDPATPDDPDFTFTDISHVAPWDPGTMAVEYDLNGVVDFEPGFIVTMTDHFVTKTQTLPDVQVTNVDVDLDTVSGTAPAGMYLDVNAGSSHRRTTADGFGDWSVDFSVAGAGGDEYEFDIVPGSSGTATAIDPDGDGTGMDWRVPNPRITFWNAAQFITSDDWPLLIPIQITVDDIDTPGSPDYEATGYSEPYNSSTLLVHDIPLDQIVVQPGDVVTLDNGETIRELIISSIQITNVDMDVDTVSGIAEPFARVNVEIVGSDVQRHVDADGDGNWSANFAVVGPGDEGTDDIRPGITIKAHVSDLDNDITMSVWRINDPNFWVFLCNDGTCADIHAYDWPVGNTITMTYEDLVTPAIYTRVLTVEVNGGGGVTDSIFDTSGITIHAGDVVTMTDGTTTLTHTVTALRLTNVDPWTDIITGTAEPGSIVSLSLDGGGGGGVRTETVAGDGTWVADFSVAGDEPGEDVFDINPGMHLMLSQGNGGGRTGISLNVSNYTLHVNTDGHEVHGHEWLYWGTVTLTVDDNMDPGDGVLYTETKTAFADTSCGDPCFNLDGLFDLQVGQYVTMTQGTISKTVQISTINVTVLDAANDIIHGEADPGAEVMVNIHTQDGMRRAIADLEGNWFVDFSVEGVEDDEKVIADLHPGDSGRAIILNLDGSDDGTLDYWRVPSPNITVRMKYGFNVEAYDWPEGSTVTLSIDDPSNGLGVDYSDSQVVAFPSWDLNQTYVNFNLNGIFDLQPGFEVTVSDGATEKTHTISILQFTDIDVDLDTVTGIASPNANVDVWVCSGPGRCPDRHVVADGFGNWSVDFSIPDGGGETPATFDIGQGTWVDSQEYDGDGDRTMFGENVPNPNISVRAWYGDQVEAYSFLAGSTLFLTIDDPSNGVGVDYSDSRVAEVAPWDPNETYASFDLNGIYDILPGFEVSVTDGITLRTHTVTSLHFTEMDVVADVVSGVANPDAQVDVWVCDTYFPCVNRNTVADGSGYWSVDFSVPDGNGNPAQDFVDGSWVDSQEWDVDHFNRTMFGRNVYTTYLEAEVWANRLTGFNYQPNVGVTVSVNDPLTLDDPDFEQTLISDGDGRVDFYPDPAIAPGFEISMTDGFTTKTMVISVLHAAADEAANTVTGISSPDAELWFWLDAFAPPADVAMAVTADSSGNWLVDLDGLYTLHTWIFGGVNETDPDGDVTYYRWRVHHPTINANLNENKLDIWDWPLGISVDITIDDPGTPGSPDFQTSATTEAPPWFEGSMVMLQLNELHYYLEPGMVVTVDGGGISDTMIVSTITNLITDLDLDTVSGTTEPNTLVDVNLPDDGATINLTSDGDGNWTADFAGSADLYAGIRININVRDEDFDSTGYEFYAASGMPCMPGDTISGHLYALDGSTPVEAVTINFDDFMTDTPLFTTITAPDGSYSCGGMTDGSYRIWAGQAGAVGYSFSRTYYPGSIYEEATEVVVDGATHLADVDLTYITPSGTYMHMDFNLARPITGELAVRQALAYGTDRQRIIDEVAPGNPIPDSFILPGSWSYPTSGLPHYGYDPVEAALILETAGWIIPPGGTVREKGGVPLHLEILLRNEPGRIRAAEIFQENMAAIGVEIDIRIDNGYFNYVNSGDFDIAIFGWVVDENADFSENGIWWIFKSDNPSNFIRYNSPVVDGLLNDLYPLRTRAEVLPYAEQVQIEVMTDLATLPLYGFNAAPTADAGMDRVVLETATVMLDGSGSTSPFNNLVLYEWDVDNDGDYDDAVGLNPEIAFEDSGVHTVGLKVTDAYGIYGTDTVEFTVLNIPPTATFNAPGTVNAGTDIALSLTDPEDPSPVDVAAGFEYAFDCGDGYGYSAYSPDNTYNCPTTGASGVRTVVGKIKDKDGGFTLYTSQVTILALPGAFSKSSPANGSTNRPTVLNLIWGSSLGAVRYEYCLDTTNDNACDGSWVDQGTSTRAAVNGLAGNTVYYWQVRAVNANGDTEANGGTWWSFRTAACYTLMTPSVPGAGGSVGVNLVPNCAGGKYYSGTVVRLTATPAVGYVFNKWSGSVNSTSNPLNVLINGNKTVTANFTQLCYTLTTGISPSGVGSIDVSPAPNCTGGKYAYGTEVELTAVPTPGYGFVDWSGDVTGSTNPATLIMIGDKSVTANFALLPGAFAKTAPTSGSIDKPTNQILTWGSSSGATSYEYCIDTSNDAVCDTGWVSTGTNRTAAMSGLEWSTTYYWQVRAVNSGGAMDADGGTWWSFTTVTGAFNKLNPVNGGTNRPTTQTLSWAASSGATSYEYCIDTSNDTVCDTGWVNTGTNQTAPQSGLAGSTTYYWQVRALNGAGTVYANGGTWWSFTTARCYTLTTGVDPSGGGSVGVNLVPNCAGGMYYSGTALQLTATPAPGYLFLNWTGSTTGTANPVSVTMSANRTVTANFGAYPAAFSKTSPGNGSINQPTNLTLTWAASEWASDYYYCIDTSNDTICDTGWVDVDSSQTAALSGLAGDTTYYWQVYAENSNGSTEANGGTWWSFTTANCYTLTTGVSPVGVGSVGVDLAPNCAGGKYYSGTMVQLTATANPGYGFAHWSGDSVGTSNPLSLEITDDKSVTANFVLLPGAFNKLNPVNGGTNRPTTQTLSWAASSGATGYEYCIDTSNDTVCDPGWVNTGTNRTAPQSGLAGSTTYYWQVRAVNSGGSTEANGGTWWSFTTARCYTLTTGVSPVGGGSVGVNLVPNCADGMYVSGTVLQLTATPMPGYVFVNWTGSVIGSANPVSVTMSANKAVTANFTP